MADRSCAASASLGVEPAVAVFADVPSAARAFADHVAERVRAKPDLVIGLATGRTMEAVYDHLADEVQRGRLSFRRVRSFNLDEYVGIDAADPQSYRSTMHCLLFDRVDIDPANTHLPDGTAPDLPAAAQAYEARICATGGIDLQILGLGRNAHIGFNEPGSDFTSRTRPVPLHGSTIEANRDFFGMRPMPTWAITMGIGTILEAREIIVLATGVEKQAAVAASLGARPDPKVPASALRRHGRVSWFLDRACAG